MDITVGTDWAEEISRKLNEATAVLVLISPYSLESRNVIREWSTALSQSRRVIPILIGGITFSQLPFELASMQGANLNEDYDGTVRQLVVTLQSLEKSQEPPVSEAFNKDDIVQDVIARVLERLKVEKPDGSAITDIVDEELVFVIASFLPDMEPAFEAIKAAADSAGLRAQRVKDVSGDYKISDRMLSMIRQARLVVADLTHERPNVYFELGYARGIGKTVITIMREGGEVHFDVQDWTYIPYIDSRPLERDLIERFKFELTRQ
jgi:TIR domain